MTSLRLQMFAVIITAAPNRASMVSEILGFPRHVSTRETIGEKYFTCSSSRPWGSGKYCVENYGLVSAPKAWYDALLEVCVEKGFDTNISEEGALRPIKDSSLVSIVAFLVDDTIGGGTEAIAKVLKKFGEMLHGAHILLELEAQMGCTVRF